MNCAIAVLFAHMRVKIHRIMQQEAIYCIEVLFLNRCVYVCVCVFPWYAWSV